MASPGISCWAFHALPLARVSASKGMQRQEPPRAPSPPSAPPAPPATRCLLASGVKACKDNNCSIKNCTVPTKCTLAAQISLEKLHKATAAVASLWGRSAIII